MSRFGKPNDKTQHRYYEERLSAYLDGELAPQEQDAVKRHLAKCEACRWDLDTLQHTVQLMSELPTVPLPRVFTIPAPAEPERISRRRWNLFPLLQGATALVALLLFLVVAGDYLLIGPRPGSAPELMLMQEQAPMAVEATQVVGLVREAEAPAAPPEAEVAVEEAVVETVIETVEVEKEVVAVAPSAMPQPTQAAAPATEARATEPQEGGIEAPASAAEEAPVGELAQEPQADEAPAALKVSPVEQGAAPGAQDTTPAAQDATGATAGGGPTPTILASPLALASPAPAAATAVAEIPAPAPAMPEPEAQPISETWGKPGVNWLRVVEVTLAVAFVLLATITVVATIQKRRAG
jgi:anti-sigma factor RsiW